MDEKKPLEQQTTTSKPHQPGEGIRSMKSTMAFRAINFELYAKPVSNYILNDSGKVFLSKCLKL